MFLSSSSSEASSSEAMLHIPNFLSEINKGLKMVFIKDKRSMELGDFSSIKFDTLVLEGFYFKGGDRAVSCLSIQSHYP